MELSVRKIYNLSFMMKEGIMKTKLIQMCLLGGEVRNLLLLLILSFQKL